MPIKRAASLLLSLPRWSKRVLVLGVDLFLSVFTVLFAYVLYFGKWTPIHSPQLWSICVALLLALPVFVTFGLYREIFRYVGWAALTTVIKACLLYAVLYAFIFTILGVPGVPPAIGVLQPLLLFLGVGASRAMARFWFGDAYRRVFRYGAPSKMLIYGAGSAGRQLAAALNNSREVRILGYVDDNRTLHGSTLNGLPIYGANNLATVAHKFGITDVLLAIPSASRMRRNEILKELQQLSIRIRTLPGLTDLAQGLVQASDVRELDVEDLLGREAVVPNGTLLRKNIQAKIVMVTGAGGSIGSELCRQIVALDPTVLLLVELSEFALYEIHQDLSRRLADKGSTNIKLVPLLASICDRRRVDEIVGTWKPHTIYHAAAYKHVPLVEQNPAEGVKNNVIGTLALVQSALQFKVSDFVLISTDKAVRPTNIMGASKRFAEMILQAFAAEYSGTCFSMVRFGNVLNSSGSVVPLFRKQIRNGEPITLTHPEMTRFFMTIREAAQLVIQASAMAEGGDVFVLDMGEPVKIIDLARRMVELSGLKVREDSCPDGDIDITVTGQRPGEKFHEELLIGNNPSPTQHSRIMKANEAFIPLLALRRYIDRLDVAIDLYDVSEIQFLLQEVVTGYVPSQDLVDWIAAGKKEVQSNRVYIHGTQQKRNHERRDDEPVPTLLRR